MIKRWIVCLMTFFMTFGSMAASAKTSAKQLSRQNPAGKSIIMYAGHSKAFKVKTNRKIVWSSTSSKVATVSQNGLVKAEKAGNVTIKASLRNSKRSVSWYLKVIKSYYSLYAQYVSALEKKHGKAKYLTEGDADYRDTWMEGVSIIRLIDMDRDGTDELFVGYRDKKYRDFGDICTYDGKKMKVYHSTEINPSDGERTWGYHLYYVPSLKNTFWHYVSGKNCKNKYVYVDQKRIKEADLSTHFKWKNADYCYDGKKTKQIVYYYIGADDDQKLVKQSLQVTKNTRKKLGIS